ncbi:NUDIX domain-containing protein [Arthrobacter sp. BL-252-APC-1A]|uniref:NUDIX hydrolase n=1 Tax=Arthrobacter sp. BL-252-APC-1A TaxID=2606622 RepID=UPI0012B1FB75|nr:NUDIX domain-containing protein [Arthrobacter sp. BL-252-APC-1A]MSS00237.1 NUDIX domain-containing protein [Arthrobacter sp. BL-252-APC-1A]
MMTLVGTAATVVLLRDGEHGIEVLLLERPRHTGTFAGAWVFPGGRVDPEDYDAAGSVPPDLEAEPRNPEKDLPAARIAGVRETVEETGLELAPESLVELSCWVPPLQAPKRLRTWFFLAPAPAGEIRLNPGELIDYAWLRPGDALQLHRTGKMLLVAPTFVTLTLLQRFQDAAAALEHAAGAVPETFSSRLLDGYEPDAVIAWHGDEEYPGEGTGQPGDRHRLVMRGSDWRYERN